MLLKSIVVGALSVGMALTPSLASSQELHQNSPAGNSAEQNTEKSVKLLSDHPGSATALTGKQKREIREFLKNAPGLKKLSCTGTSLSGQRESMYRVVRLRAQLVCDYAKSLDTSLVTIVREKTVTARHYNGRVVVVIK